MNQKKLSLGQLTKYITTPTLSTDISSITSYILQKSTYYYRYIKMFVVDVASSHYKLNTIFPPLPNNAVVQFQEVGKHIRHGSLFKVYLL